MLLFSLLSLSAHAAEPPCYGINKENQMDSAHYWVAWDGDLLTEADATSILDSAEAARQVYKDMGFTITDEPVLYRVGPPVLGGGGASGLTRTETCEGVGPVPIIDLYLDAWSASGLNNLVAHELAHVVQYSYMGNYDDAVVSWLWWMEASATWMAYKYDDDAYGWRIDAQSFASTPDLALEQDMSALIDPSLTGHMYGSTMITAWLEARYGLQSVIDTWEWGGPNTGSALSINDALDGTGLGADDAFSRWMADAAAGDHPGFDEGLNVFFEGSAAALPASFESWDQTAPQGHGMNLFKVNPTAAKKSDTVAFRFDGDPSVPWRVVLAKGTFDEGGNRLVDYVPLRTDDNGVAEGWLTGFTDALSLYVVVSPDVVSKTRYSYTVSAEVIDGADPMPGTVVVKDAPASGGCNHGAPGVPTGGWALASLMALAGLRRRQS